LPDRYVERYALVTPHAHQLILETFNDAAKRSVLFAAEYFALAGKASASSSSSLLYGGSFQQMDQIVWDPSGSSLLTGFFTGMVLALQSSVQLQALGQTALIGSS